MVYDAGVLVAADRNDRQVWADHGIRLELGVVPTTTAPVVAQTSRSAHQVQLRRFLRGCEVAAFSGDQAHEVGSLLAKAEMSDVVDAHVTLTAAQRGSAVLTSDYSDITRLASHLPTPIQVQPI